MRFFVAKGPERLCSLLSSQPLDVGSIPSATMRDGSSISCHKWRYLFCYHGLCLCITPFFVGEVPLNLLFQPFWTTPNNAVTRPVIILIYLIVDKQDEHAWACVVPSLVTAPKFSGWCWFLSHNRSEFIKLQHSVAIFTLFLTFSSGFCSFFPLK